MCLRHVGRGSEWCLTSRWRPTPKTGAAHRRDVSRTVRNRPIAIDSMVIYVGDARDVIKRIRDNHCAGNVEASALRKHIAVAKGYNIISTRRPSRSTRVRIDHPASRIGEAKVSEYIRSAEWKYIICNSYEEAHDFQWYVIETLEPLLNVDRKPWNTSCIETYEALLGRLNSYSAFKCSQLRGMPSGSGVYVLYHVLRPHEG